MMPQLSGVYFIHITVFLSGNHKLTATAKVIVKICEHEVGTVNWVRAFTLKMFNSWVELLNVESFL